MDRLIICVQNTFMHHLRQRWVRENRVHQILLGRFQLPAHDVALNQFCDFSADHMCAQQLTCFCVKYGFDHAFSFSKRDGFAIADKREAANFDIIRQSGLRERSVDNYPFSSKALLTQ